MIKNYHKVEVFSRIRARAIGLGFAMLTGWAMLGLAYAEEQMPTVQSLQSLTTQWIELQQAADAEERQWIEQKAFLQNEGDLLSREKRDLQEEIQKAQASENTFQKEKAQLLRSKESIETELDSLWPQIERAESMLNQWQSKIPTPLAENYINLLKDLKYADSASVSQHLQAIFALLTEIEEVQNRFHLARDFLTPTTDAATNVESIEQEYQILFQGLVRGYAVSVDGKRAAIGTPLSDGWQWQAAPRLAGRIAEAIRYYQKEEVAQFVSLPLQISGGATNE